jgi:hypothetical protein
MCLSRTDLVDVHYLPRSRKHMVTDIVCCHICSKLISYSLTRVVCVSPGLTANELGKALNQEASTARMLLEEILGNAKLYHESADVVVAQAAHAQELVKSDADEAEKAVREHMNALRRMIDTRERELLAQIQPLRKAKTATLRNLEQREQSRSQSASKLLELIADVLTNQDLDLLREARRTEEQVDTLLEQASKEHNCDVSVHEPLGIRFSYFEASANLIRSHGTIYDGEPGRLMGHPMAG